MFQVQTEIAYKDAGLNYNHDVHWLGQRAAADARRTNRADQVR